jgi:DNA-binding MurR/RpiR family transcriptional regulator
VNRLIAPILLGATVLPWACTEQPPPATAPRLQAASQGLCDAVVFASQGRVRDSARVFDAETHDYLHELARMLQDVDPAAAADLLEAKERVESVLDIGADPLAAQDLLVRLQRAVRDAALAADLPTPLCRDGAA